MSTEEKLRMIEFCHPIFAHIRAVRDILNAQGEAKQKANGEWNEGYAAAISDSVKALNGLLADYS